MLHGVAELRTAATDAHSDSQQLIRAMSSGLEQVCRARARTSPFLSVMCCIAEHSGPCGCYQPRSHARRAGSDGSTFAGMYTVWQTRTWRSLTVRVDVDELRCRRRVATRTSPNGWLVRTIADGHCTQHTTSLDLVTTSLQQSLVGQIEDALSGVGQHFAEILSVAVSHTEYGLYANTTHVFSIGNHTRATVNGR